MSASVAWETVRQAADGDAGARQRLVEETLDGLWALAMRLTRRADEAEDVVQETYARLFATLSTLAPTGRFEGYLARIATNLVVQRWRSHRPATPLGDEPPLPAPSAEPWRVVADREDRRRRLEAIWDAVGRLPPGPRAAVLLYYAQGLGCDEVARTLEVPVGTVKTWLHRARDQIRQAAENFLKKRPALHRASGTEKEP